MVETFYDEVEIEDMDFDEDEMIFHSPCPCGDRFEITLEQLQNMEEIARCPSCSLIIRIIYDPDDFRDTDEPPPSAVHTTPAVLVC